MISRGMCKNIKGVVFDAIWAKNYFEAQIFKIILVFLSILKQKQCVVKVKIFVLNR